MIFIEGGGDESSGKAALRQGLGALLAPQRARARQKRIAWDLVLCGGRNATFDAFQHATRDPRNGVVALLVDAEGAVASADAAGRVAHLSTRKGDGWDLSWADPERVHLMTQSMETWIVADPEALQSHYGQGFAIASLPKRTKLDEEDRHAISRALETSTKATQKGGYHKIHHASALLQKIRPDKVSARCESFRLFTTWLDGVIAQA